MANAQRRTNGEVFITPREREVAFRKKAMAGDNACCFDKRVNKISNSQD